MEIYTASINDTAKIKRVDTHISPEFLKELIAKNQVYILEEKGEVEGVLRYSFFWQSIPFLDLIFLNEAYRNKGIGTLMMEKWESAMKAKGYNYVMTSTQADETAYEFYEKRGYIKKGGFFPPEQEAEEIIYIKEL